MKNLVMFVAMFLSLACFADAVKLSTLTALKDFYNEESPRRAFIAVEKEQVALYSNHSMVAYVAIPEAMAGYKQQENFNDLVTWNLGTKATEFVGFLIPAEKNEEINGSSIKVRANFDGLKITMYEETYGNHAATIKTQIKTWLNTNIPNVEVF